MERSMVEKVVAAACDHAEAIRPKWQPMETLHKSEQPVLLRVNGRPVIASWDEDFGWDQWLGGRQYGLGPHGEPEAWAPLPEGSAS